MVISKLNTILWNFAKARFSPLPINFTQHYTCTARRLLTMSGLMSFNVCRTIESSSKDRHSLEAEVDFPNLKVVIIPALADNFMYLVVDKSTRKCFVVDPVDPQSVLDVVQRENAELTSALITHHHWDHAGGNNKLLAFHSSKYPNQDKLIIYGGDDRIEGLNKKVKGGDKICVGGLSITCLFTPCHTTGHICYFVNTTDCNIQNPLVFTGDTLFIGGCGRFFEGNAQQMDDALNVTLGTLPADTLVFCGHEYTEANLRFVLSVEPKNLEAKMKWEWAQRLRNIKHVTVPSTISEEMRYNIFMRNHRAEIQKAVKAEDPIDCMDKLRTMKNNF